MLVLTRQLNESIIIDGRIEVMVVEVRHDKVRLGIIADKEISVHRAEVQRDIERENAAAAKPKEPACSGTPSA